MPVYRICKVNKYLNTHTNSPLAVRITNKKRKSGLFGRSKGIILPPEIANLATNYGVVEQVCQLGRTDPRDPPVTRYCHLIESFARDTVQHEYN